MDETALEVKGQHEIQKQEEQNGITNSGFDIATMLPRAGTLAISDKQTDILFAPPIEEDIEIRPDGLVYAPWMEYQDRLNKAFGLEWCLIPEGNPKVKGMMIYWKFHLVIQGIYMTAAIGVQEYHPNNPTMNYGDAVEGARSNALMRVCKHLGVTKELWKPSYVRAWKEKYAEEYTDLKGKRKWRKKGTATVHVEEPVPTPVQEPATQNDIGVDHLRASIRVMVKEMYSDKASMMQYMKNLCGAEFKSLDDIADDKITGLYHTVCNDYNEVSK